MNIDPKQLARILVDATDGQTDVAADVKTFVTFLAENNMLDKWREVEQAIEQVWKETYGASTIRIVSAHELTDAAREALANLAPGAEVTTGTDERLIGGAVIRMDDKRIDGSIVGRLRTLKRAMSSST